MTTQPSSGAPPRPVPDSPVQSAQASWREAHDRLQAMLEALPDLLFVLDGDGRIYDYHAPGPDRLYVPPDQFMGKTMNEVLPNPARDIVDWAVRDAVRHGFHRGSVYPLPTPAGNRWFEISIAAQGDPRTPEGRLVAIVRDITERYKTEAALREKEERFEQSARQSRTFLWEVDADGLYTYVSPVVEDLLGYRPEELVGRMHYYDLFPPTERDAMMQAILPAMERRESFRDFENALVARNGGVVWVVTSAIPLVGADGTLLGYRGSDTDITERKRAEEELRASEAKYRLLHETIRDGFASTDMDGRIRESNPGFQELTGYSAEELTQLSHEDLTPRKWHAKERRILREQVLPRGYSNVYQKELVRKDGTVVPVELRTVLIRDAEGNPTGMWGNVRDITARRRADRALRKSKVNLEKRVRERTAELEASREALAQNEEQFRQMAEIIQEVFWLVDGQTGEALYVSPAFERIWGRSPRQDNPSVFSWAESLHPDDREHALDVFRQGLAAGTFEPLEVRVVRPDGSMRWIEVQGWLMPSAPDRSPRVAGVMRDITLRRQMEAELLTVSEEERQRIGRDLHDSLGQALTGIGYLAEALREDLERKRRPEAKEIGKLAHLVEEAADRSHAMARGLLLMDVKRGGLAEALQELAFRTQKLFAVECRYEGLAEIDLADMEVAGQLYRIAQEATTNAARHAGPDAIEIRMAAVPEGWRLTVRDTGTGLFADSRSERSGMGLDIMRHRAGLIGATFRIDSEAGKGTTVTCLVPRRRFPPETQP